MMKFIQMIILALLIGAGGMMSQAYILLFEDLYNQYLVAFVFWALIGFLMTVFYEIGKWAQFMVSGGPYHE